jgi:hypothetical protein
MIERIYIIGYELSVKLFFMWRHREEVLCMIELGENFVRPYKNITIYWKKGKKIIEIDVIRREIIIEGVKKVAIKDENIYNEVTEKLKDWLNHPEDLVTEDYFSSIEEYVKWRELQDSLMDAVKGRVNIQLVDGMFFTELHYTDKFLVELEKIFEKVS